MKPKRDDRMYIPLEQALQASGLEEHLLRYHVRASNIRTRQLPNGDGRRVPHFHIDDCHRAAYPRVRHLARDAGLNRRTIRTIVKTWFIPGVTRFGNQYRFSPDRYDDIVKWIEDGRPVRPPFLPREVPACPN